MEASITVCLLELVKVYFRNFTFKESEEKSKEKLEEESGEESKEESNERKVFLREKFKRFDRRVLSNKRLIINDAVTCKKQDN